MVGTYYLVNIIAMGNVGVGVLFTLLFIHGSSSFITNPELRQGNSANQSEPSSQTPGKRTNQLDADLIPDDAQSSSNFFTSDIGSSFDLPTDYAGGVFDHFPDLPYFPEFGEIFRISRTTTPQPPFRFPSYVRDAFPDGSGGSASAFSDSYGGRRPSRRPPRPASSGTRTKVSKHNQNEPKEKARSLKSKPTPGKSRTFPKIFRFTADRVNLADFDMKKKINENYLTLSKGDELDSDKVKRNEFLILHGGVFEIEPNGRSGLMAASSDQHAELSSAESVAGRDKRELNRSQYFYKK
ncbi:uncharacterized protein TNIN_158451 [Trichonephila inaurata madagascariensis]|uniref:Uncharacterized protein n=1 Tax=Trichonephila inaurata madagascariensis TaxID=2747483 RepID=A0A8X6Y3A2_9ARAC|nr:uncharacterized protein TNIN_158451 [Trichonephila inaurata madagascariensis]